MSNGTRNEISLHKAIKELDELIQNIERVGVENLPDRVSSIPKPDTWLASLKETQRVMRQWCDGFSLELKTKR